MGLEEKYNEYKENKEAKDYFRENNDEILTTSDYAKAGGVGLLVAIAGGFITSMIADATGFTFGYLSFAIGLAVGFVMKKVAKQISIPLGVIAVVVFLVGLFLGILTYFMMDYSWMGMSLLAELIFDIYIMDTFQIIILAFGAVGAFKGASS